MTITKKILAAAAAFAAICSASLFAEIYDASLDSFPRKDGETGDSARIMRAVESTPKGILYIPAGTYKIDSTVKITNSVSLLMHKSARFVAENKMDFMFVVNVAGTYYPKDRIAYEKGKDPVPFDTNVFIEGGEFDARGLATCMKIESYRNMRLEGTSFKNGSPFGLQVGPSPGKWLDGIELVAKHLFFQTDMTGLAGNVAIKINEGDSHYNDITIVDYTTGIMNSGGGSNRFTRIRVFYGNLPAKSAEECPENIKNSVGILLGGDSLLRDCVVDSAQTGYKLTGEARLLGCSYNNSGRFKPGPILAIDNSMHAICPITVSYGRFSKKSDLPGVLYKGTIDANNFLWANNRVIGFSGDEEKGDYGKYLEIK